MRSFFFLLIAFALIPLSASCASSSDSDSSDTSANEINQQPAGDQGVVIGPAGGGVRDTRGVFSIVIPPNALSAEARVFITRDDAIVGAQGTAVYRVRLEPDTVTPLRYSAQVVFDAERILDEPIDLRLASGPLDQSPSTPLTKIQHGDLKATQFVGATKDLAFKVFGLATAKKIDCDGTACSNCCLVATSKLTCSPSCAFDAGELTVDCLRDSDCGGGLKCCTPNTVRGGGVLRVDDNRVTCKADCGGENLHVCDMTDPNRCSTCKAAQTGCTRGFCGQTSKTPTQLICPGPDSPG